MNLRDIDALVADHVIKYRGYKHCDDCYQEAVVPAYSSDIAAAWQVVEKVGPHLKNGTLSIDFQVEWDLDMWRAGWTWYGYDGPEWVYDARSESAPLAICLAALKAVGCEVPA